MQRKGKYSNQTLLTITYFFIYEKNNFSMCPHVRVFCWLVSSFHVNLVHLYLSIFPSIYPPAVVCQASSGYELKNGIKKLLIKISATVRAMCVLLSNYTLCSNPFTIPPSPPPAPFNALTPTLPLSPQAFNTPRSHPKPLQQTLSPPPPTITSLKF